MKTSEIQLQSFHDHGAWRAYETSEVSSVQEQKLDMQQDKA